ncbi:hypothetical protein CGCSCA4_v001182 [Colletotrichum siamense]|uniref:Uncharacterized protein n=1 Tax=Colletotrichum siamense TaxID=690259 RepID=A0A9P5BPL3_COLSI|nr:uncharacterized protein CGCS363_v011443 [Colletotrichum siamense]KAF4844645.1 hypothetical protein CGCSCA2_v013878 [Colletotrichum siamense]KAF4855144.1 hypothetical protein CGCSCA4_v001182 [Colletotrichum siamense]KAF5491542.1 hypothetical protein CGCS363_v011443 [Colletotrichum siamense]
MLSECLLLAPAWNVRSSLPPPVVQLNTALSQTRQGRGYATPRSFPTRFPALPGHGTCCSPKKPSFIPTRPGTHRISILLPTRQTTFV